MQFIEIILNVRASSTGFKPGDFLTKGNVSDIRTLHKTATRYLSSKRCFTTVFGSSFKVDFRPFFSSNSNNNSCKTN